jgi:hypothetical protein
MSVENIVYEELHNLYSLPYIFRMIIQKKMRWVGHVMCLGEECIQSFSRKFKGKRPLGRPRYRWDVNIKMNIRKMG